MSETRKGGRKPSRRQLRYGRLVRGWNYRWLPELRDQAEQARKQAGISRTEFLERAILHYIVAANNASTRTGGSVPANEPDSQPEQSTAKSADTNPTARR